MVLQTNIPGFITELMQAWLSQFEQDSHTEITQLGLFHWEFKPNRRNPDKPRRKFVHDMDNYAKLRILPVNRGIYFLQIDESTLHVFQSSGIPLASSIIAHEYSYDGSLFRKKEKALYRMIS